MKIESVKPHTTCIKLQKLWSDIIHKLISRVSIIGLNPGEIVLRPVESPLSLPGARSCLLLGFIRAFGQGLLARRLPLGLAGLTGA